MSKPIFLCKIPSENCSLLKKTVDVSQTIINEATIVFDKHSLSFFAKNSSRICVLDVKLCIFSEEAFFSDPERTCIEVSLNMNSLKKILDRANSSDEVEVSMENEDAITFTFKTSPTRVSEYTLRLMNLEKEDGMPFEEGYDLKVAIQSKDFCNIIKNLSPFSDDFIIEWVNEGNKKVIEEVVFCASNSNIANGRILIKHDGVLNILSAGKKSDCALGKRYMIFSTKIIESFSKFSCADKVEINVCESIPLKVVYSLEEKGHVKLFLAYKIKDVF